MGRRGKMKNTEDDASIVHEEANNDLSLELVQKELLIRSPNPENDVVLDQPRGIALSEAIEACSERKKPRKKMRWRKKKKNLESGVQIVACNTQMAVLVQEEAVEIIRGREKIEPAEAGIVQMSDNVVLRKLLRGPRYFDPPADSGWGTCYNCGEEGHATARCAANSTGAKQKRKPCFLCGSSIHQAKRCRKARDCFICRKIGHNIKNCPALHVGDSICLKCGISGHNMFSCKDDDYSLDDLKEMQCYVCKRFGHLCCANTTGSTPTEISCYKCGQTGHTGLACPALQIENAGASARSASYKCNEEEHSTRESFSSVKVSKRKHELSNTKTPTFLKENDNMGDKSAPHDMGMPHGKKKPRTEERAITTQQQSKHRGGWMVEEHHDEISPSKSKRNSWKSPVMPLSMKVTKIHSFSSEQVSKRKRELSNTKTSIFQKEDDYMGD